MMATLRSADTKPAVRPVHLLEAEALVDRLATTPARLARNRYRHAGRFDGIPDRVEWGSPGATEEPYVLSRCASFLTRVIERAYGGGSPYGWAKTQFFRNHVEDWPPNGPSPHANTYRTAFARGIPHFTPVTAVRNLRPGDLVSIDYNQPGAVYTGHIVMIRRYRGIFEHPADQFFPSPATPHVFEVIDCSSRPHGDPVNFPELLEAFPDTRAPLGSRASDGVGYGHMIVYEDQASGGLAGYRRSPSGSSVFTSSQRPIAAARIEP